VLVLVRGKIFWYIMLGEFLGGCGYPVAFLYQIVNDLYRSFWILEYFSKYLIQQLKYLTILLYCLYISIGH